MLVKRERERWESIRVSSAVAFPPCPLTSNSRMKEAVLRISWSSNRFTSSVSGSILMLLNGDEGDVTSCISDWRMCSSTFVMDLRRNEENEEEEEEE